MRIHHYTSIETLGLILKNRTIRFNRSVQVDDPNEIELEINGYPFAKYLLLSCWTLEEDESIPQWGLYAGKGHGVRITLNSDHLFQNFLSATRVSSKEEITTKVWNNRFTQPDGTEIFAFVFSDETNGIAYVPYYIFHGTMNPTSSGLAILPPVPNHDFLTKIDYVDSLNGAYSDSIKIINTDDRHYSMNFTTRIGYKKHKSWSFQKEARFILMLMHTVPRETGQFIMDNPIIMDIPNFSFTKYGFPPINKDRSELFYFDLKVDNDAFAYLEEFAGPETSEDEKSKIKSILQKYAPSAKYSISRCRTKFNR